MEKRDMIVIVVAIFIVLIMAMYIKPLVTGKEAKLIPDEISGLFSSKNETTLISENNTQINGSPNISGISNNTTSNTTFDMNVTNRTNNPPNQTMIKPTPVQTQWDGTPVQVGYAYSGQQGGFVPRTGPISEYQPYSFLQKPEMMLFTEFTGKFPITTNTFEIPKTSGYWEIEYTVDYESGLQDAKGSEKSGDYALFLFNKEREIVEEDGETKEIVRIKGGEYSEEDYTGTGEFVESVSLSTPSIQISVIKHENNESKVIRTITPGGGLDPYLWNKAVIKEKMKETSKEIGEEVDDTILDERVKKIVDPRPWTEKFYERGNFSLIIEPSSLKSYDVKIKASKGIPATTKNELNDAQNPLNQTLNNYIQYYNADVADPDYIKNILKTIAIKEGSEKLYSQMILSTKAVIPELSGYKVYSTDMSNGNIRGEIYYDLNGHEKWMPLDIYLVYSGNLFKLPEPVLPKY